MKLNHTLLLVCLGVSVAPLVAQLPAQTSDGGGERPAPQPVNDARVPRENADGTAERKSVAYLGVLTREVSPELRSHFSLSEGFGLMVDEVMRDSPAQAAGLKAHDVLLKFDDQRLVNMEQLMALVRARKKGDVASLSLITGGKETQVQVTLAERVMPIRQPERSRHPQIGPQPQGRERTRETAPEPHKEYREQLERHAQEMRGYQERVEKWQQEMRVYQEHLRDWTRGNHGTPMPKPPVLEMPAPGGREQPQRRPEGHTRHSSRTESHAAATITRRDESGEYTLRREDQQATFSVRGKDGKEQSWPVTTEAERKGVPEHYQDKLREMEKGMRIERDGRPPGTADPRPMPSPAEPKPEGKPASA